MDFLKTHVRASAQALLIICRYLGARPEGRTVAQLQQDLQPEALVKQISPKDSSLLPSLKIGEYLGMVIAGGDSTEVWSPGPRAEAALLVDTPGQTTAFYVAVLQAIGSTALADLDSDNRPSDVAMGLTWLGSLDPYDRIAATAADADPVVQAAQMAAAIGNGTQWPQFTRWAKVLGLVTATAGGRKSMLAPDCTRVLHHLLPALPREAEARRWIDEVHTQIPVLGPRLVAELPQPPDTTYVGGSLALALTKLDHTGKIKLVGTADATSSVIVRLGGHDRVVGHIQVLEAA
ncbi:hypothetical protein [Actinokineospora inagensis]|uniref:hypothetical protein n=1 Tax=Actinokineospora inagensis TaxID=103730 RepID=UPI000425B667|nr:hypothetical protein [Actinokineospora inagensis]